MLHLLVMLALSIADAVFLILFIKWSRWQEQKLSAILEEYKFLKKSTELYILSAQEQQKFKDFDDYFEKVFKSLQESKANTMKRINESQNKQKKEEEKNKEEDGSNMV